MGTAEWGHPDYKPHPDIKEIIRLLNYAWSQGIRTLDTADSYGLEFNYFGGFNLLNKSRYINHKDFYHYQKEEAPILYLERASLYTPSQITKGLKQVIIPLNINQREFITTDLSATIHARSPFNRGKLLEEGYTISDCLKFVQRHHVKSIIIGIRSVEELKQILEVY